MIKTTAKHLLFLFLMVGIFSSCDIETKPRVYGKLKYKDIITDNLNIVSSGKISLIKGNIEYAKESVYNDEGTYEFRDVEEGVYLLKATYTDINSGILLITDYTAEKEITVGTDNVLVDLVLEF